MNYNGAFKYMTKEQCARMGRASQRIQAIQRLANADHTPIPVRSGLQMGFVMFDCRGHYWNERCVLLFDAGKENRYRWMADFQKQDGLVGWNDAIRESAKEIGRPLLKY